MKEIYEALSWQVAGEAGYGITTMGQMFARACMRAGLSVYGYAEYPSLIRGGHNTAMVTVHPEKVHSHTDQIDILLALNEDAIEFHKNKMRPGGVIIYDGETLNVEASDLPEGVQLASVPLARITKELGAKRVMRNTVGIGASFAMMGLPFDYVKSVLESTFKRKGQEVVDFNVKVAEAGYKYEQEHVNFEKRVTPKPDAPEQLLMSGNQAMALGAVKAGVKFMAAYPMTPVTSIMLGVAAHGVSHNIVMKHTEDEIAAMNMTIGAAHMGVRALTATSGGGFSLMSEALGMAAITEVPLVAINGTRPGPSTGLPTWTDQGDLRFVMHASQGEFPRMVMIPGDVTEAFHMTADAFNWAEEYQMVVLLMTDKYLGESITSIPPLDSSGYEVKRGKLLSPEEAAALEEGTYKRYELTEDGVSPRALPGYPNTIFACSTDEHNEFGDLDESGENRILQVDKRARKLDALKAALKEEDMFELHGPEDAELTVVGWGSTMGPILDALSVVEAGGRRVNFLRIKMASPFPTEAVTRILSAAPKTLMIENNAMAQMAGLIREHTGIALPHQLLRYDGRPLNAPEILAAINQSLDA